MMRKVEKILKEVDDLQLLQISSCYSSPVDLQGYLSETLKITYEGTIGKSKPYIRHLYIKYFDESKEAHQALRLKDCYSNEVYYYKKLQQYLGDFGPRLVHAGENELFMEDLTYIGYEVIPHSQFLNYYEIKATLKRLAEFHAASLNLKLRNLQHFLELVKPLREVSFPTDNHWAIGKLTKYGLNFAIDVIRQNEPKKLPEYEFLLKHKDNIFNVMNKLVQCHSNKYDILSHGDLWKNNVLFKYLADSDIPLVKFIDFQILRHSSIALDIHYLMYSSLDSQILDSYQYQELLLFYHSEFIKNIHYKSEIKHLNLDWFKAELQNYALFGLVNSFLTVQACYNEYDYLQENQIDLNNSITKETNINNLSFINELENHMTKLQHNSMKSRRILNVTKHFMKNYTINGRWLNDFSTELD